MTGYTVHTGSTKKFAEGWQRVFGSGKRSGRTGSKSAKSGRKSASKRKK